MSVSSIGVSRPYYAGEDYLGRISVDRTFAGDYSLTLWVKGREMKIQGLSKGDLMELVGDITEVLGG